MTCWVNTTKKLLESHQTLPHSTGTAGDETNLTHAVPICLPSHTYHKTTILIIILHSKLHSLNKGTFILKCGHIVNGVEHFICTLYIMYPIYKKVEWNYKSATINTHKRLIRITPSVSQCVFNLSCLHKWYFKYNVIKYTQQIKHIYHHILNPCKYSVPVTANYTEYTLHTCKTRNIKSCSLTVSWSRFFPSIILVI